LRSSWTSLFPAIFPKGNQFKTASPWFRVKDIQGHVSLHKKVAADALTFQGHASCLTRQSTILISNIEINNIDFKCRHK